MRLPIAASWLARPSTGVASVAACAAASLRRWCAKAAFGAVPATPPTPTPTPTSVLPSTTPAGAAAAALLARSRYTSTSELPEPVEEGVVNSRWIGAARASWPLRRHSSSIAQNPAARGTDDFGPSTSRSGSATDGAHCEDDLFDGSLTADALERAEAIFQKMMAYEVSSSREKRGRTSSAAGRDGKGKRGKGGEAAAPVADGIPMRKRIHAIELRMKQLMRSRWLEDQALSIYVNKDLLKKAIAKFATFVSANAAGVLVELSDEILDPKSGSPHEGSTTVEGIGSKLKGKDKRLRYYKRLFPLFACFVLHEFPDEISTYRALVKTADLRRPHENYRMARSLRRRIIYHAGPTNSGKTYTALQRLKQADTGVYCAPLRLLAMGVTDSLNAEGVPCNLVTGQERIELPGAGHVSSTVEMVNLAAEVDVAVIDEIQMIGDESRGWAWTRAVHGMPAREIHVCGDGSAIPLLRSIAADTGDAFEVVDYERFSPLTFANKSLGGSLSSIERGDCIIAFSRKEIYILKKHIEGSADGKFKCCVVYGALPPEARRRQAYLFNASDNDYDVMIATDAIGMGLNLNIRRVVFNKLSKIGDGGVKRVISSSLVKQIAGRAGRRGTRYPEGIVTTLNEWDRKPMRRKYNEELQLTESAGLFPTFEQVELLSGQLPDLSFPELLVRFAELTRLDGQYFLCKLNVIVEIAEALEHVKGLSLNDRFNFATCPVKKNDPRHMKRLLTWARQFSMGHPVSPFPSAQAGGAKDAARTGYEEDGEEGEEDEEDVEYCEGDEEGALDIRMVDLTPMSTEKGADQGADTDANDELMMTSGGNRLQRWEDEHSLCSLYVWLSFRFGVDAFPHREAMQRRCEALVERIVSSLETARAQRAGDSAIRQRPRDLPARVKRRRSRAAF